MTRVIVDRKGAIFLLVFVGILHGVLADTSSSQGFKEVYDHFWSKPIDNWEELIIRERVDEEAYMIKSGDTLSELSEVFFGTPHYWPKIWSLNDYIKNPHLIYPGNKIVFKLGSVSNSGAAPKVLLNPSVNKKDKDLNPQANLNLESKDSQFMRFGAPVEKVVTYSFNEDQEKLPPKQGPPVLQNLPPSFPTWRVKDNSQKILSIERQYSKLDFNIMQFDLESFLSEGELDSLGHVVGFLDGEIGEGTLRDTIFIKNEEENLSLGGVYTLVKFEGKAQTDRGKSIKDAYIYSYLGEVKILKSRLNHGDFFSGQVVKSVSSIPKGALVISGKIPVYNLKYDKRNIQSTPAKILRGNRFYGRGIYSVGQTVYLSEGKNGGLGPGSILKIEQDSKFVKIREDDEGIDVSRLVGWVKVVKVEESFSTGIIIISHGIISSGDKVVE